MTSAPTIPTTLTAPSRAAGFAGVLRAARQAARLTQSEVAAEVGVQQSTVSQWERGQVIPTLPLYCGLIAVLGPWPLLEALLPPDNTADPAVRAQMPRSGRPGAIAASIRAARRAVGLTQAQLGVRVGVRQSAVGQWEGGRTIPTLPMLRRLVGVLGPWPLLGALLPPERAGTASSLVALPPSRDGRPSREELARLVVQEGRSDQQLAAQFGQPIWVILRWRRGYRLDRAASSSRALGRPAQLARPSPEELARLVIQQGRSDQELAARYGCSAATIKSWRAAYGLVRERRRIDRAQVLSLVRRGLPVDEIAEAVGCTPSPIYQIAKAAGVQVASGGRLLARRPPRTGRVETEGDLTVEELTAAEVAGLFQVSESAVHTWANQDRLPFRRVKGQRRFPAAAVARLAHQHQVPLPDWLANTITSARPEPSDIDRHVP